MNATPPTPLGNDDPQLQRIGKMLSAIRRPLYRFIIEAVITALQAWQNMTEEQREKYA
jgi:hypothetical protein